jgi:polygalacturonase
MGKKRTGRGESRRGFLTGAGALGLPLLLPRTILGAPPAIDVRRHGARGDGRTKDTLPLQAAIDAAARAGGAVRFPSGEYVSGTLRLRSGVTLRLDAGATLIASSDDDDFDPPEDPVHETFADRETRDVAFALLRGQSLQRVAIVGPGRIDGGRSGREGPKPIALRECRGVRIHGPAIANAGNYNISLLGCDDVDIEGVTITNGYSDGIDPDCCRRVRIAGCRIESRDDAIVLKTSLALGRRRPTEDVTVTGCHLVTMHNGLKLGTESSGDFRRIVFRDCVVVGWRHPWKGELSSGVALTAVDGGTLERVTVSRIRMADVRAPIFIRLGNRGRGQAEPVAGALRDVTISEVVATGASGTSSITGLREQPIARMVLRQVTVTARGGAELERVSGEVPEADRRYPDATSLGELPAYGLYCRHVAGLTLDRVELGVARPDPRPAGILDRVRDVTARRLRAMPPADGSAAVRLRSVDGSVRDEVTSAILRE